MNLAASTAMEAAAMPRNGACNAGQRHLEHHGRTQQQ
jgi:hypothetical protein